jgi:hypothetical protein
MPSYTSKSGQDVPEFQNNGVHFIHGDCAKCKLPCCKLCNPQCLLNCQAKCQCWGLCEPICVKCRGPCKPVCAFCKKLNCCDVGPEMECKAVGCELTLGIPAIENLVGVWHIATIMFPKPLPAIIYPCCFGPPPIKCPGGKDEEYSGGNFKIGGPTDTQKIKILQALCGSCAPYERIKASPLGLMMDPAFDGNPPAWYGTGKVGVEVVPPQLSMGASQPVVAVSAEAAT